MAFYPQITCHYLILPFLAARPLKGYTSAAQDSILALLKSLGLSKSVQVFVTLPNAVTEDGYSSRQLIKLYGRQDIVLGHTHSVR